MKSQNRYPGIDRAIVKQVQYHAWRLSKMACFAQEELEDLEQELFLQVHNCMDKYDAEKSSIPTFVDQIVSRRSNNIIQKRMSLKQGGKSIISSINEEDESGVELLDKIPSSESRATDDFRIDVQRVMKSLPPTWRELCLQLQVYTITEISKITGKSRASIYRIVEQMRAIFAELVPYIMNPSRAATLQAVHAR